jgi:hypothetical protein
MAASGAVPSTRMCLTFHGESGDQILSQHHVSRNRMHSARDSGCMVQRTITPGLQCNLRRRTLLP